MIMHHNFKRPMGKTCAFEKIIMDIVNQNIYKSETNIKSRLTSPEK